MLWAYLIKVKMVHIKSAKTIYRGHTDSITLFDAKWQDKVQM